ncbi:EAL domain-containing protein [Synechococcus sp. PCC 7336]|uniref:EAL domain-containing protein n=1 Tax=Synechococcus sp. PCC 7336 TaxID=195250 RepID=UPI0006868D51|nr:EAL domain-containing protein [Synechococcus sp. PCC 7336]
MVHRQGVRNARHNYRFRLRLSSLSVRLTLVLAGLTAATGAAVALLAASADLRSPDSSSELSVRAESRLPAPWMGWMAGAAAGGTVVGLASWTLTAPLRQLARRSRAWPQFASGVLEHEGPPGETSNEIEALSAGIERVLGQATQIQSYWNALLQACPEAVFAIDADGTISNCNPAAERFLQRKRADLIGCKLFDDAIALLRADSPILSLQDVAAIAENRILEAIVRPPNGPPRSISLSVEPIALEPVNLYIAIARDLTQQKALATALHKSEERYALTAAGSRDGLWDWRLNEQRMTFSARWQAMLGLRKGEIGDRPQDWFKRVHPDDRSRLQVAIEGHLQGKAPIFQCEYRLRHTEGQYRWMSSRGIALRNESGQPYRLAGSQTDISDRKRMEFEFAQMQARQQSLFFCALDPIITVSADGKIVEFNPAAERTFGFNRKQVLGMDLGFVFLAPWNQRMREHMSRYSDWGTQYAIGKKMGVFARRANGSKVPMEISISRIPVAETPLFTLIARDIAKRLQSAAALKESEERYALAVRGANDGIWDWELKTNQMYFSPRWKSLLGYSEEEMGNSLYDWFERVHPDDLDSLKTDIMAHIDGHTSHFENEHRILNIKGEYQWMLSRGLAVRDKRGRAYRIAGSQTDITARKAAEEKLRQGAYYDTLTGLPNRALFMERLRQAIASSKREPNFVFAVLFLDCDRFKVINDSLGHTIGDRLLCEIARQLEYTLRPIDTVARLGGDEFVLLLEGINTPAEATQVAERIFSKLRKPFAIEGREIFTAVSIGIVSHTSGYSRPEEILRDADLAMYRAKAGGKDQYVVFDAAMRARAIARLQSETDLRRAVEREEFSLHYQPILSLSSGRIVGFEALLRWNHPERGLVSPAEFIPLAEETGAIVSIGDWVMLEACRQLAQWQRQFVGGDRLNVSVNVSSKQIARPDFVERVQRTLQMSNLAAESLKLEITESIIMDNLDVAIAKLDDLHVLGTKVYIDDFGTGYSSFSYLQDLPVDALKVDRAFVSKICNSSSSWQIVQSIVTLAHALGLEVVAEGVETHEQLVCLGNLKCEFCQGYLIAPPLDVNGVKTLLTAEMDNIVTLQWHNSSIQRLAVPSQFPLVATSAKAANQ